MEVRRQLAEPPVRGAGRLNDQMRPLRVSYDVFGYAPGSVLFELGNTKVLCAVTMQPGVPSFLRGSKTGWLSAEYALLPTATTERTQREGVAQKRNGRSVEISRLIGRSLRAVTRTDLFGERTITVDCDVLQADGGTRSACISAACLALKRAQEKWLAESLIPSPLLLEPIAAVSVGLRDDYVLLDLDCTEDQTADADFNFVLTASGSVVEMQGSVEKCGTLLSWKTIQAMYTLAQRGVQCIFDACGPVVSESVHEPRVPLFSLENRLKAVSRL